MWEEVNRDMKMVALKMNLNMHNELKKSLLKAKGQGYREFTVDELLVEIQKQIDRIQEEING